MQEFKSSKWRSASLPENFCSCPRTTAAAPSRLTGVEGASWQKVWRKGRSGFERSPGRKLGGKFRRGRFDVADYCPTMEETVGGNRGGDRAPQLPGSGAERPQGRRRRVVLGVTPAACVHIWMIDWLMNSLSDYDALYFDFTASVKCKTNLLIP